VNGRGHRWLGRGLVLGVLTAGLMAAGVDLPVGPRGALAVVAQRTPAAQTAMGQAVYERDCARCHGPIDGQGDTAPTLFGPDARKRLAAFQTAAALFSFLRFAMPQDRPGSLSEAEYWAVLAFLLRRHGLLADDRALDPAVAQGLALTR
jgi:cytochrome c